IGPLLAGAGVLGLAIGFGAQKLVTDVITGVFIQMENAINAGDIVTVGGLTGTAEKLTIRSLGLRDLSGTYHIIPFSAVDTVSNYMREFAYHVGEYGVAYREDTDEVVIKLREAFEELLSDDEQRAKILSDELEVHGVTALADSSVNIRIRIKTLPGNQWAVGREYNRLVKRHLDAAGIEIPFPHLTLYFGEDKQGNAPAMPLKMLNDVKMINDTSNEIQSAKKAAGERSSKSSEYNPTDKGDFDDGE
ncbi:MAG: mechanosensitive ion channel domain-containing protein, partial [Pseudomonadota bacterium]|nr:mechanosensitive ion channel domain-containing protein [Pseudomonadota bacterium]